MIYRITMLYNDHDVVIVTMIMLNPYCTVCDYYEII